MPKPKRHKILVEVTDYEGRSARRICQSVENALKSVNKRVPSVFVNAKAKSMPRVIRGLLIRLSYYEALNILEGKSRERWGR